MYRRRIKPALDRTAAAILLVALSPLLLLTAIAVAVFNGRPVLFRQIRPGLNGQPFTLLKFRTMSHGTDLDGRPLPDATRLRRLGRFLRATSLDELPELFNVVRHDMSLVGPRPLLVKYLERYTPEQARRHEVRPGITGWAQVNGRNELTWEKKFELDVWYVDHVSFWLDVKILCLTALRLIRASGINKPGQATTEEFLGPKRA